MIGYYLHHQGRGHYFRAVGIAAAADLPVTALSSAPPLPDAPFTDYVPLPHDDDDDDDVEDPRANGVLHWAPVHSPGLRGRMAIIAGWIAAARPDAMVVDVSVEVALFARMMGVPVIVMAMPGGRGDAPHRMAYQVADRIIAAWPGGLYAPDWLTPHLHKTVFVGGISRFAGRRAEPPGRTGRRPRVLVLGGTGGSGVGVDDVESSARRCPEYEWRSLGIAAGRWADDPWPALVDSDVVVAHAGQGSIADVAAARRPAVVIPQPRPYDEQVATAETLAGQGLAVTLDHWPTPAAWPAILERARGLDGNRWVAWGTDGAARRAAAVLHDVRGPG